MSVHRSLVALMLLCALCNVNAFRINDCSALQSKMRHSPSMLNKGVALTGRSYIAGSAKSQLVAPIFSDKRIFGLDSNENTPSVLESAVETIKSVFRRFLSSAKELVAKLGTKDNLSAGRAVAAQDNVVSTFVTAPSTPVNQMLNVKSGRMYAEAKLQEIDALFKRVTKPVKKATTTEEQGTDASPTQKGQEEKKRSGIYERKRSVMDLADEELAGKRVLMRCDLDVPLVNGVVSDDSLLNRSLATIQHLSSKGAKVILAAHLGTPTGTGYEAQYSFDPVAKRLSELLGRPIPLIPDCFGLAVGRAASEMVAGDVVLLENLRFYAEEEKNDPHFAKSLVAQADVFVNDAVDSVRRALASTEGVARAAPIAVSGLALKKQLDFLQSAVQEPARPFVAIVSGDELASQVTTFESLLLKADHVIVSGQMASAFVKARGADGVAAKKLKALAVERGVPILALGDDSVPKVFTDAKTLLWSGVGTGTTDHSPDSEVITRALNGMVDCDGVSIVVGQRAASALGKAGLTQNVSFVTNNEEIALDMLRGADLPGVAVLHKF